MRKEAQLAAAPPRGVRGRAHGWEELGNPATGAFTIRYSSNDWCRPRAERVARWRAMNLLVSLRPEEDFLRFDVQGQWQYNDALALAYHVKAVAVRERMGRVLIDVRGVTPAPFVEGKFLLWDRLRRVLSERFKIALLAPVDLIDLHVRPLEGMASVVLFTSERAAVLWLEGMAAAIKNPSVFRSEGQVAGKET